MGQYYKLTCPETGTHIDASCLGSFVKAYEQVWSTSQPAALAFLCSAGRGDHPRDLPWAPQGLWAGRMPLMVGDYAEKGDLIGRDRRIGQPECDIYEHATRDQVSLTFGRKRKFLKDLSRAFLPIYERAMGMHAANTNVDGTPVQGNTHFGRGNFFPAKKTENGWDLDLDNLTEEEREDHQGFYERMGAYSNTTWQRDPVQVDEQCFQPLGDVPNVIPSKDEGQGGTMLWVNLDRREFVDPAAMGDTPDLVGVMGGLSSRSVLGMIVHHERRGGGDLGYLGSIEAAGRWRGDRIVLLGEKGFKPPKDKRITQEQVRETFLDVTRNAEAFIKCDDWFDAENFNKEGEYRRILTQAEREILAIAMQSPSVKEEIHRISVNTPLQIKIVPPTKITYPADKGKKKAKSIDLAPSFDLYIKGGKFFLDAETRAKINPLLARIPRKDVPLKVEEASSFTVVSYSGDAIASFSLSSNHEIINAYKKAS